ncbi:BnaA05g18260D [Brassica napus]|uniref:BnaA05g18260D protein n=3 Tax=Brassica TaxID=3705 RepID=A0A078GT92_BRANA|nr:BnaA05g18260D [Brassica napus]
MVRQVDGFEGNVQHLQQNPLYNYKTCKKDVQHAIHCYYLVVRISDESKGEAKFLLFNNIGEKLIRRLASELVQEAAQRTEYLSGYGNPKERKKVEVHYARENGRV